MQVKKEKTQERQCAKEEGFVVKWVIYVIGVRSKSQICRINLRYPLT